MKKLILTLGLALASFCSYAQFSTSGNPTTTMDNVGIGTTIPYLSLEVAGDPTIYGGPAYQSTIQSRDTRTFALGVGGGISFAGNYTATPNHTAFANISGVKENGSSGDYSGALIFSTRLNGYQPSEKMRINSSGYVGIGTPSPGNKLDVDGGASETAIRISTTNTGASAASLILANSSKTAFNDGLQIVHGAGVTKFNDLVGTNLMSLDLTNGKVGIGTTTPVSTLQLNGDLRFGTNGIYTDLRMYTDAVLSGYNQTNSIVPVTVPGSGNANAALHLKNITEVGGTTQMHLLVDGNVGIGTINPDAKLAVNGTIHSQEVKVDMNGWSDYVFEPNYDLPSLTSVKTYIDNNHRLPEMPSTQEVIKSGINLGEMVNLQMKKIEELTLYLIKEHTQNQVFQTTIAELERRLKSIENK